MTIDIVRTWKDQAYRASLRPEQQALLPENPVGAVELTDEDLGNVAGGAAYTYSATASPYSCCSEETISDYSRCCTFHHPGTC